MAFLFLLIFASSSAFAEGTAFLDLEDDQIASVFNKPGMNWDNCSKDPDCKAIAWPDNSAEIEVISSVKKMKVLSPFTDKIEDEEYVKVKYSYKRKVGDTVYLQQGEGWIDAAYVSYKKKASFYGNSLAQKDCPPSDQKKSDLGLKDIKSAIAPITKTFENNSVSKVAEELQSAVGKCVINPKNPPKKIADGNTYDNYVLPQIKDIPQIKKEDGTLMSKQELIDIDSLARTLYGELAGCYKHGLQYPITVAKIAVNRAEAKDRHKEFIRGSHSSAKSDFAKILTSGSQFNVWMRSHEGEVNPSLLKGLCPPSDKSKTFWRGHAPPQFEQNIWKNTVRIATEAVLFPKSFKKRTQKVSEFFYSASQKQFFGMKQVFPWIEERQVSRNDCVQVWKEVQSKND